MAAAEREQDLQDAGQDPDPGPDSDCPEDSASEADGGNSEDTNDVHTDWKPRRTRGLKSREEVEAGDVVSEGLRRGYRVLQDLMKTNSTFLHRPKATKGMYDYYDIIEKPIWFEEIKRRYDNDEYSSVKDFVADVRLLLSNTYRYFGPGTVPTKRALRVEHVLENKLFSLPMELRSQCSLEATHGIILTDEESEQLRVRKGGEYCSALLERFSNEREERKKRLSKALREEQIAASSGAGKEALTWECDTLLAPPAITQMRTMWELPLIGHFIQLTSQVLHIDEVPQFELERIFLMPQASKTLARLMTSLLSSPIQRPKLHLHPPMPYSIWSCKLFQRVSNWYKLFNARHKDTAKLFELTGIEKEFWSICGDWNQLEDYDFHELSFHQRVWLVKTLCDYLVHHHKTMQDALADHSQREQDCEVLGEDRHKRQYLHFPQFFSVGGLSTCCLRIYRRIVPDDTFQVKEDTKESKFAHVLVPRRDFFPSWLQRGRGRGKKGRYFVSKRRKSNFDNKNFLSRMVYRMPNGMYIKQRKKYTHTSTQSSNTCTNHEKIHDSYSTVPALVETNENNTENQSKDDTDESARRVTRPARNTSKYVCGLYTEWSESDSQGSHSPGATPCKKRFSKNKPDSNQAQNLRRGSKRSATVASEELANIQEESDGSDSVESEENGPKKSLHVNGSVHDSGCDDGTSRSSCWLSNKNSKARESADESDEAEDDERTSEMAKKDFNYSIAEDPPLTLPQKDSGREKRPRYDPHWLLLGAEHFELVAESVQGVRDLIDSLCESDEDLNLYQRSCMTTEDMKPACEKKLEQELLKLIEEVTPLELKMECNVNRLRCKLHSEWKEFKERPADFVDKSEECWLGLLSQCSETINSSKEGTAQPPSDPCSENHSTVNEDSQTGGRLRHFLRAKKPKVDMGNNTWLNFDSELSESGDEDELDDVWEMPRKRQRRKLGAEKKVMKKITDDVPPSLMMKTDTKLDNQSSDKNARKKILPNKLTLDKEGNMFITLSCGTKVQLKTDPNGRIIVPDGHEGLSMISGKTLEQLVGTGKVVQNKKRRPKTVKHSTTLFPATPIPRSENQRWAKDMGGSIVSASSTVISTVSVSSHQENVTHSVTKESLTNISCPPQTNKLEEIVILSDESDDSIEVIKEAKSKTPPPNKGVPRIQSVVGNANLSSFETKPLTKSVTLTPVIVSSKSSTPRSSQQGTQWSPVISNACSLEQVTRTSVVHRVKPPGEPQVVITPAKSLNARRNLHQTDAYQQPSPQESFLSAPSIPVRPSQAQFIPVTQIIQNVNQPVSYNSQFIVGNSSFPSLTNFFPNNTQGFQLLTVPTITPHVLPVHAADVGLPPGLFGEIVLAPNSDNQYSYAFKLDDGGLIFLTNQQISKIRAANGGRLPTMIKFCTQ